MNREEIFLIQKLLRVLNTFTWEPIGRCLKASNENIVISSVYCESTANESPLELTFSPTFSAHIQGNRCPILFGAKLTHFV